MSKGGVKMEEMNGDKIKGLESEIERLKKEKLHLEMMFFDQQNALILHEKFCTRNHTGGGECGWFYEIKGGVHNWEGSAHKDWLQKAHRLIHAGYHVSDVEKIKEIMGSL